MEGEIKYGDGEGRGVEGGPGGIQHVSYRGRRVAAVALSPRDGKSPPGCAERIPALHLGLGSVAQTDNG
jgi:hypothetical protein